MVYCARARSMKRKSYDQFIIRNRAEQKRTKRNEAKYWESRQNQKTPNDWKKKMNWQCPMHIVVNSTECKPTSVKRITYSKTHTCRDDTRSLMFVFSFENLRLNNIDIINYCISNFIAFVLFRFVSFCFHLFAVVDDWDRYSRCLMHVKTFNTHMEMGKI